MDDELKPWSEEGATDEELELITLARHDGPGAKTHAALMTAIGVAAASSKAAVSSGMALGTKVLLAGLLTAGVGGTVVGVRHFTSPQAMDEESTPVAPASPAAVAMPEPTPEPAPELVPETAEPVAPSEPAPQRPRAKSKLTYSPFPEVPSTPASTLAAEVKALDAARKALAANQPAQALTRLDAYRATFPQGNLAAEEIVLRVQTLMAQNDQAGAQALAESFAKRHPNSPYAKRLRELVEPKKP